MFQTPQNGLDLHPHCCAVRDGFCVGVALAGAPASATPTQKPFCRRKRRKKLAHRSSCDFV